MTATTASAHVLEAKALLEQAAELLKGVRADYAYAWDLIEVLAERMDYPDASIFQGAYNLVSREDGIKNAERLNQAMLDVAMLLPTLGTVVGGYGDSSDALKLHYRLDAIQRSLIEWGREHAEGES